MTGLDLELIRILVAAGVITVGQPWGTQTVQQARQFFLGVARQLQTQEMANQVQTEPTPEPKKTPGPKSGSKKRATPIQPTPGPVKGEPADGDAKRTDS